MSIRKQRSSRVKKKSVAVNASLWLNDMQVPRLPRSGGKVIPFLEAKPSPPVLLDESAKLSSPNEATECCGDRLLFVNTVIHTCVTARLTKHPACIIQVERRGATQGSGQPEAETFDDRSRPK